MKWLGKFLMDIMKMDSQGNSRIQRQPSKPKHLEESYRLISLLSAYYKIYERLNLNRISYRILNMSF